MAIQVRVPTMLREHTGGERRVNGDGQTLGEVLEDVGGRYPGLKDRVVGEQGDLHRFVNVFVNDEDVRYLEGMATPVADGDTVSILPAVAGG